MEVFENVKGSLEIKGRSWEARMTQNGKKRVASWLLVTAGFIFLSLLVNIKLISCSVQTKFRLYFYRKK